MITAPGPPPLRGHVVSRLADLLVTSAPDRVLRVAIDGPDAAGKTTLADELADAVTRRGRPVVRAGVDGFHQPTHVRRRRGSMSAEGYFLDAFDYPALRRLLLDPLGPTGDRRYRDACFDHRGDTPLDRPVQRAADDAVLVVDGVFLLRAQLRDCWDLGLFLQISPAESLRRALRRDVTLFGSDAAVRTRYAARYLPAQELYHAQAAPRDHADVLIDNERPDHPVVLRWPVARRPA
ncbi:MULTISPECIES: uridine kinase [Frankia]|uniref:Kinase n=1 Tax=Frankia alni (strain DSM 45986 / CECT 9034 / ACN14a) TaxID=326424 RepID=Q0RJJ5_FRAAA|nr:MULTISPECIES: uridine kinase [Frankia]CAJ62317.1 putative kinase [Frankia alni ACN14a]